jgi:hypothetical protein
MVISVRVSPRIEFETAFAAMMKQPPDALAMGFGVYQAVSTAARSPEREVVTDRTLKA